MDSMKISNKHKLRRCALHIAIAVAFLYSSFWSMRHWRSVYDGEPSLIYFVFYGVSIAIFILAGVVLLAAIDKLRQHIIRIK